MTNQIKGKRRSPPPGESPLLCESCSAGCEGHKDPTGCRSHSCECPRRFHDFLGPVDKTRAPSGWGYQFHHTDPQRYVHTAAGSLLVPRSADSIPRVPIEHVEACETAIRLLADMLADRDHQRSMGDHTQLNEAADREADALRRLAKGELRAMLGIPSVSP